MMRLSLHNFDFSNPMHWLALPLLFGFLFLMRAICCLLPLLYLRTVVGRPLTWRDLFRGLDLSGCRRIDRIMCVILLLLSFLGSFFGWIALRS
jgi:hypothetical protein